MTGILKMVDRASEEAFDYLELLREADAAYEDVPGTEYYGIWQEYIYLWRELENHWRET